MKKGGLPLPPTPVITLFISELKSRVLKLSFLSLEMMVKSGLEFIFKLTEQKCLFPPKNKIKQALFSIYDSK